MSQFVRFQVSDPDKFQALRRLFLEVRKDKEIDHFRTPDDWIDLIPTEVRARFYWPSAPERERWLSVRSTTPISVGMPDSYLGRRWNFYSVFEAFENGEYSLLECEMTDKTTAEMRIEAWAYPYGGVGCLIALAEAFGFGGPGRE